MALIDVRRKFITDYTGRYDLVVDGSDFSDNGADYYLNAGQKWLDRKIGHKKSPTSFFAELNIGGFYVIFMEARAVNQVWASTNMVRWELGKKSRRELRTLFPQDYSQIGKGGPCYYTPVNFQSSPPGEQSFTIDQIGDIIYSSDLGSSEEFNGILLYPPTDKKVTIEVVGLFYTPKLELDTDRTFWTEREPNLLILAACRAVEASYRNRQGVIDYEAALDDELMDMDKDFVEEEIANMDTLKG